MLSAWLLRMFPSFYNTKLTSNLKKNQVLIDSLLKSKGGDYRRFSQSWLLCPTCVQVKSRIKIEWNYTPLKILLWYVKRLRKCLHCWLLKYKKQLWTCADFCVNFYYLESTEAILRVWTTSGQTKLWKPQTHLTCQNYDSWAVLNVMFVIRCTRVDATAKIM